MRQLIILRGAPGSGKSTFANLLSWEAGASCHAADDFFEVDGKYKNFDPSKYNYDPSKIGQAHAQCQAEVRAEMILKREMIVVHNTNVKAKDFKVYEDLAKEFKYDITYLVVENRHGGKSVHNVPEAKIEEMKTNIRMSLML